MTEDSKALDAVVEVTTAKRKAAGTPSPFITERGQPLNILDFQSLEERWIDQPTAEAAGLRRVYEPEAAAILNRPERPDSKYAGILIPYGHPGSSKPVSFAVRRDKPDYERVIPELDSVAIAGEVRSLVKSKGKYLRAPGCGNRIYFPPYVDPAWLKDSSVSILLTEGEFKTLAADRLARQEGVKRFLPIGISGAWAWRGSHGAVDDEGEPVKAKGPIKDLDLITWADRSVILALDADATTNESVEAGVKGLSRELRRRGAIVYRATWDAKHGKGLDDLLAQNGPEAVLRILGAATLESPWENELQRPYPGGPVERSVANVQKALRGHPQLQGLVRLDLFRLKVCTIKEPPWGGSPITEWSDKDNGLLSEWLGDESQLHAPPNIVNQAVDNVAKEIGGFHPVQDWLNTLEPWDGVDRLPTFFQTYFGTEDSEFIRLIGPMFIMMFVARGLDPGCKQDSMTIFEGEQGQWKSTALRALMPAEHQTWFSDAHADLHTREGLQALQGVLLFEVAELASTAKAEQEFLKAFISRREDVYRVPYDKRPITVKRSVTFCGSTNSDSYLGDPTGARRFLPVKIGKIDLDKIKADQRQLFAEALNFYKAGQERIAAGTDPQQLPPRERWWLTLEEQIQYGAPEQDKRNQESPLMHKVLLWIDNPSIPTRPNGQGEFLPISEVVLASDGQKTYIGEILEFGLQAPAAQWHSLEVRVGNILKKAGWERHQGPTGRYYTRPPGSIPSPPVVPLFSRENMPF